MSSQPLSSEMKGHQEGRFGSFKRGLRWRRSNCRSDPNENGGNCPNPRRMNAFSTRMMRTTRNNQMNAMMMCLGFFKSILPMVLKFEVLNNFLSFFFFFLISEDKCLSNGVQNVDPFKFLFMQILPDLFLN